MKSRYSKQAGSPTSARARKSKLPRASARPVQRQVEADLVQAAQRAAEWAAEQGLPPLVGLPWEVQAGELVRAMLAEDVERWQWALTFSLLTLAGLRPEHAMAALRDIAAADRAAAETLADQDVAFWRKMAEKVPGDSIRDVLGAHWQEVRERDPEDQGMLLVRYLQHPDTRLRELAVCATATAW